MAAGYVAAALVVAGCQTLPPPAPKPAPTPAAPERAQFTPAAWEDLPGWSSDPVADAWPAFLVGCRALVAKASTRATWQAPCAAAQSVDGRDPLAVRAFFVANFSPYRVSASDGNDVGLVTGYYEPLLAGSRARSDANSVPLYAPPDDLLVVDLGSLYPELKDKRVRGRLEGRRVVPYWPRAEFERHATAYASKALVYVGDPIEAFFLEIQGSGRIALDDGSVVRLNYADQNGHPYRSVARVLIDRGELTYERSSMQAISAWAQAHPDKVRELLDENPSYVFFREVPPAPPGSLDAAIDGPQGALGVPLLAERAIAVDPRSIPLGAPVFLATTEPLSSRPLNRLTLAQDTGGAIRGAVRADFFWGFGPDAGRAAGRMKQEGRMWLLWPKGAALPSR
jgi:membrane-bound lytic murein transglycosylase A